MRTIAEIEKALELHKKAVERWRAKGDELDAERHKLDQELDRTRLSALVGQVVIPRYRGDYPDWDAHGGTLIEVRRSRCSVQVNGGGRWNCPVYDVLPATQSARQGETVGYIAAGGAAR